MACEGQHGHVTLSQCVLGTQHMLCIPWQCPHCLATTLVALPLPPLHPLMPGVQVSSPTGRDT